MMFPELGQGVTHDEKSMKAHQDAVQRLRKEKGIMWTPFTMKLKR
jgi:hypothetical protein